jgi:hypothetical protein
MVVAKIDKDLLFETWNYSDSHIGKEFDFNAMRKWWGWDDLILTAEELITKPHTRFKLYDDDNELYYEGWLYNDDQCLVQQFVLAWAETDSGCTVIKVRQPDLTWTQEID